jgi:replicative DNA helicase
MKHGLGLVIIDYLQLMQGANRTENRQQEVSDISRNLKILARELEVPVLCASQLNRGVEARADKRPLLGDLRESGCLTGDSRVALASGEVVPIADLVGTTPDVVALDGWSMSAATATKVWQTGVKPVFRLKTATGREIRATDNHPFLQLEGWKPLGDLTVGDRIGIPRSLPDTRGALQSERLSHLSFAPTHQVQTSYAATAVLEDVELEEIAASDVYWDSVTSIEPDGVEPVYDMTVPGPHNFVANGIIVHNSIEQDSDIVMFIYRDEVYNGDSEARGEAELHIAKHRNGPTKTIRLAFMNQYTKFASIARSPGH